MLHLSAALASAVTGQADRARRHVNEATETAGRTGDGTFAGLYFGPRNVGVWRVTLAIELGEPGRIPELARAIDVAAIPSAGRQAAFYGDVGCGLASIRGREAQAVEALRRAEQLAPQRIRTSPFVRETVNLNGVTSETEETPMTVVTMDVSAVPGGLAPSVVSGTGSHLLDLDRQYAERLLLRRKDLVDRLELLGAAGGGVDRFGPLVVEHLVKGVIAGDALDRVRVFSLRQVKRIWSPALIRSMEV